MKSYKREISSSYSFQQAVGGEVKTYLVTIILNNDFTKFF